MVTLQQDVADVTAINCRQDHGQSFITAPDLRRRGRVPVLDVSVAPVGDTRGLGHARDCVPLRIARLHT